MNDTLPPALYCDTSALAKLVAPEKESDAFASFVERSSGQLVSSVFGEVELMRASKRLGPRTMDAAREILAQIVLLPLTEKMRNRACYLGPETLRSLDAIHLASAMEIEADLDCLVTYDRRLASAASETGIRVMSPGA